MRWNRFLKAKYEAMLNVLKMKFKSLNFKSLTACQNTIYKQQRKDFEQIFQYYVTEVKQFKI